MVFKPLFHQHLNSVICVINTEINTVLVSTMIFVLSTQNLFTMFVFTKYGRFKKSYNDPLWMRGCIVASNFLKVWFS